MRHVIAGLVFLLAAPAAAGDPTPFSTRAELPIGVNDSQKTFVAIDQVLKGTVTKFTPVAYSHPKWKKTRGLRLRTYTVDTKDAETEARTKERSQKARDANDKTFGEAQFVEASPIRGGFTGRYRVPELDMVVYLEEDTVYARTGEMGVMKTMQVVPAVSKLIKRCKGTQKAEILHVVARAEWKSVAVYVQSTCSPEDPEAPGTRSRKLYVAEVSEIL